MPSYIYSRRICHIHRMFLSCFFPSQFCISFDRWIVDISPYSPGSPSTKPTTVLCLHASRYVWQQHGVDYGSLFVVVPPHQILSDAILSPLILHGQAWPMFLLVLLFYLFSSTFAKILVALPPLRPILSSVSSIAYAFTQFFFAGEVFFFWFQSPFWRSKSDLYIPFSLAL